MKVQYVSIRPTELAEEKGCYSFTPELLASVGARYSRNNEGLDAIASKIDWDNQDKSVDSIFKLPVLLSPSEVSNSIPFSV